MLAVLGPRIERLQKQIPGGVRLEVDWSHPMADGLKFCFIPQKTTGFGSNITLMKNLASQRYATAAGTPGAYASMSVDQKLQGFAPDGDGTDDRWDFPNNGSPTGLPLTMMAWINGDDLVSDPGVSQYFMNQQRAAAFGCILVHFNGTPNIGTFAFQKTYNAGATVKSAGSQNVLSNNVWTQLGCSDPAANANGSDLTLYKDGASATSASTANGTGAEDTFSGVMCLAGRSSDNIRNFNGRNGPAFMWIGRALPASQWRDMYDDPLMFIVQRTIRKHFHGR